MFGYLLMITSNIVSVIFGAPFVPLSRKKVKTILFFGGVSPGDIFYDLGCGDGRILVSAVRDFGVKKGIGWEAAFWPYYKSLFFTKDYRGRKVIEIFRGNLLKTNLVNATFIYLYLLPKITDKVAYKIAREAGSGTKILSPRFAIDLGKHPEFKLLKSGLVANIQTYLYERN